MFIVLQDVVACDALALTSPTTDLDTALKEIGLNEIAWDHGLYSRVRNALRKQCVELYYMGLTLSSVAQPKNTFPLKPRRQGRRSKIQAQMIPAPQPPGSPREDSIGSWEIGSELGAASLGSWDVIAESSIGSWDIVDGSDAASEAVEIYEI